MTGRRLSTRAMDRVVPGLSGVRFSTLRSARTVFSGAVDGLATKMWLAIALTIGATLSQLLIPWPLQIVLDRVLIPISEGTATQSHAVILTGAALASVALPLWSARFTYHASVTSAEIGKTAALRIRRQLFDHLNRLSLGFHTESRTGDLLVRLTGDVNLLRDMLFTSWLGLADRALYFLGLTVALAIVDIRLALLALSPLPFLTKTVRQSTSELRSVVRSQRKREGSAAAFASESLSQIRVVKAYSAEDATIDRFSRDAKRGERAGAKAARLAAGLELSTQRVSAIGSGLVLFAGAILVILGQLSTGVLLVAVAYTKSLYKPLRKMSSEAVRLSKATAVAERVLEILNQVPEPRGVGLPIEHRLRGEIDAHGVSFRYPGGDDVLCGVDLHLAPGTLNVLTGPNGVGKSTLLSLLLRFAEPTDGQLRVDGRPIDHYRLSDLRARIAYVPQSVLLFSGTLRENILLGNPGASDHDVERAIGAAHLEPVLERLGDGLETEIGERGETMSGGEARRVMLARATVRDADILLLDEPFEGIDVRSRPLIAESIRTISKGRTTIVVSHVGVDDLHADAELRLHSTGIAVVEAGR